MNYGYKFLLISITLIFVIFQIEIKIFHIQVNGERNPSEVYVSFRDAVLRILGMSSGDNRDQDIPQSLEAEVSIKIL